MSRYTDNDSSTLLHWAEDDYERGLDRLRKLGCEPSIHTVPDRIEGLLFAIQSAVECSEGFVLDTDRMNFITERLDLIRVAAGLQQVANSGDVCSCGYPVDSSMCRAATH